MDFYTDITKKNFTKNPAEKIKEYYQDDLFLSHFKWETIEALFSYGNRISIAQFKSPNHYSGVIASVVGAASVLVLAKAKDEDTLLMISPLLDALDDALEETFEEYLIENDLEDDEDNEPMLLKKVMYDSSVESIEGVVLAVYRDEA